MCDHTIAKGLTKSKFKKKKNVNVKPNPADLIHVRIFTCGIPDVEKIKSL